MQALTTTQDDRVIVGFDGADDAGVVRLEDGTCLVQTVDFLTPIADDPSTYGAIAAANALSDVWAMGGVPVSALNILCWPDGDLEEEILALVLSGAKEVLDATNVALLGGHSVRDRELKFGLAVTGVVAEDRIWTNAGSQVGDQLVLTKPLGTGIVSTAVKRDACGEAVESAAISSMLALNRQARDAAVDLEVHACTDITGNGLAGHGWEMAQASGVSLRFELAKLPLLPGVLELATEGFVPGGTQANADFVGGGFHFDSDRITMRDVVLDPQTSGGLLFSLPPHEAQRLTEQGQGIAVGEVAAGPPGVWFR